MSEKVFPYQIIRKVGSGAFGDVFKASHLSNQNKFVAVKCENIEKDNKNRLLEEYNLYKQLNMNMNHVGIPKVYFFGKATIHEPKSKDNPDDIITPRNVMVLDYLGPSIEKLFLYYQRKFSAKTILMIAIQCLDRLEFIHNNGIIHRDIKPDNFLIGSTSATKPLIYLVDYGLSKRYIDIPNYKFNPFRNTKSFTGTYRFCSMRNHKCIEQSRRDDLESLGYMILFLFKGELPWQNIQNDNKDIRSNLIFKKKNKTALEDICEDAPDMMIDYIRYCRLLKYEEVPNYNKLRKMFTDEMDKNNYILDNKFEWNTT